VRGFWRGDEWKAAELAERLAGSSDLYQGDGRRPSASINFVVAHDGFTLADLVSYAEKHNEANGEENRDGADHNLSANYGVEGPTDDPELIELRARQQRNFLATLLFSQGVPMICGGDEIGRTQGGNNNAYCQDNEISWLDWNLDEAKQRLLEFTQRAIQLRHDHPNLRRRKFFSGQPIHGKGQRDVVWLRPDGEEMAEEEWDTPWTRALGMRLAGGPQDEVDHLGQPIRDDALLLLLNGHWEPVPFTLSAPSEQGKWRVLLDTSKDDVSQSTGMDEGGKTYQLEARSLVLLTKPETGRGGGD
jgi:glycogen operon protein